MSEQSPGSRSRVQRWWVASAIRWLVLGVFAFAAFRPIKVLPRIRRAPSFSLTGQDADRLTNEELRGGAFLPLLRELRASVNPRLRIGLIVLGVVLLFVLAGWFALSLRPYSYHGMLPESSKPLADFTLSGPGGEPVRLSDFRGRLVVLYFGYTFCPDVCPTTMAQLGQAMRTLGSKADGVQVIMVTVDPERDTPDKLNTYVTAFDPRFIGLSGTPDQIASAATPLGVYYEKHAGSPATNYLVDHTATTTVIDKDGRVRLVWPYGTPPDELAADLDHLLR